MGVKTLIVKPEQSGKTFVMLNEIREHLRMTSDDGYPVNIIISQSNLLQVKQTGERVNGMMKNDEELMYQQDLETGDMYLEFSSHSNANSKGHVLDYILGETGQNRKPNILCCGHPKRFSDISYIISRLRTYMGGERYSINVWCDEADAMINLLHKHIMSIVDRCNINLYCLTATPDKLIKKYGDEFSIYEMENTTIAQYYGWTDIHANFNGGKSHIYYKLKDKYCSNIGFVKFVLKKNLEEIVSGSKWFIPSGYKKVDHTNMAKMLFKKGFNVMILNGDGATIYDQKTSEIYNREKNKEPEQLIPDLYEEFKLDSHPFALTGNLCIERGITIINLERNFQCDHNIMPFDLSDPSKISQIAGRVKGNYKGHVNFKIPIVYCTEKFDKKALEVETRSRNLANIVYNSDFDSITYKRFKAIRPIKNNMNYYSLMDETVIENLTYDKIPDNHWFTSDIDPNVQEIKPATCKSQFSKEDGVWVHSDKKKRIFGDSPPGGGGSGKVQWVLVYDSSLSKYTFIKCKFS